MKGLLDTAAISLYFAFNLPFLQTGEGLIDIMGLLFKLTDKTDGYLRFALNIGIGVVLLFIAITRAIKAYREMIDHQDERKEKRAKKKRNV